MASALPNEGGVGEDLETAEIQADAVGFATGKGRAVIFAIFERCRASGCLQRSR